MWLTCVSPPRTLKHLFQFIRRRGISCGLFVVRGGCWGQLWSVVGSGACRWKASTAVGYAVQDRSHFRPRVTPWLLVLWLPLLVGITEITSLGNAVLPAIWAWAIAIRRPAPVDRSSSSTPAAPHLAS